MIFFVPSFLLGQRWEFQECLFLRISSIPFPKAMEPRTTQVWRKMEKGEKIDIDGWWTTRFFVNCLYFKLKCDYTIYIYTYMYICLCLFFCWRHWGWCLNTDVTPNLRWMEAAHPDQVYFTAFATEKKSYVNVNMHMHTLHNSQTPRLENVALWWTNFLLGLLTIEEWCVGSWVLG